MKTQYKFLRGWMLAVLISLIGVNVQAEEGYRNDGKDEDTASRSYTQSFSASDDLIVEINNKYGQIIVAPWDEDSVKIEVIVTAYEKTSLEAKRTLDRVNIRMDKSGQTLTAESVFDRNSGFFVEVWNNLSGDSRALLSKSKLEINYHISMPANLRLRIDNKFGSVYMQDHTGRVDLELSHGNFKTGALKGYSNLSVSFGDIRAREIQHGRIVLKGGDADIKWGGELDLYSNASSIRVRACDKIRVESRSDKELRIQKVKEISGEVLFTGVEIEEVSKRLDLELTYADLFVEYVSVAASSIDIRSKSSDLDIRLDRNAFLDIELEGPEEDMILPLDFRELDKTTIDDKKNRIRLNGKLGNQSNYLQTIRISSKGGSLDINWSNPPSTMDAKN